MVRTHLAIPPWFTLNAYVRATACIRLFGHCAYMCVFSCTDVRTDHPFYRFGECTHVCVVAAGKEALTSGHDRVVGKADVGALLLGRNAHMFMRTLKVPC